jgi:hypothetical protein
MNARWGGRTRDPSSRSERQCQQRRKGIWTAPTAGVGRARREVSGRHARAQRTEPRQRGPARHRELCHHHARRARCRPDRARRRTRLPQSSARTHARQGPVRGAAHQIVLDTNCQLRPLGGVYTVSGIRRHGGGDARQLPAGLGVSSDTGYPGQRSRATRKPAEEGIEVCGARDVT